MKEEIIKDNERNILLLLRDEEKSITDLAEKTNMTKRWMRKKLNDLNERGALLERNKKGERFVRLSENVKFTEERNYLKIMKPLIPSMLTIFFFFILVIYSLFKPDIFELCLVIFTSGLAGLLPSLIWITYRTWKEPSYIHVWLDRNSVPKPAID